MTHCSGCAVLGSVSITIHQHTRGREEWARMEFYEPPDDRRGSDVETLEEQAGARRGFLEPPTPSVHVFHCERPVIFVGTLNQLSSSQHCQHPFSVIDPHHSCNPNIKYHDEILPNSMELPISIGPSSGKSSSGQAEKIHAPQFSPCQCGIQRTGLFRTPSHPCHRLHTLKQPCPPLRWQRDINTLRAWLRDNNGVISSLRNCD
jgi:hypothetical protein